MRTIKINPYGNLIVLVTVGFILLLNHGNISGGEESGLREEFEKLLQQENVKIRREKVKSLIESNISDNVLTIIKEEAKNKDIKRRYLAVEFLPFLPDTGEKANLLKYLYINEFPGKMRYNILFALTSLRKRETIPLYLNELDEEILFGRHRELLGWCVGENFLINIVFPWQKEWWNSIITKVNVMHPVLSGQDKKRVKEKLIEIWLENKDFLYWRQDDKNLQYAQRFFGGYFQIDENAKSKQIPINQYNKNPLTPEEIKQLRIEEKEWEKVVSERNKNLSLDILVRNFQDTNRSGERVSIISEIGARYYNHKEIIPMLIQSIDDETADPFFTDATISLIAAIFLEILGAPVTENAIYEAEDNKESINELKEKCNKFWAENNSFLYWSNTKNTFLVDHEAKAAGIPTEQYRQSHPWPMEDKSTEPDNPKQKTPK